MKNRKWIVLLLTVVFAGTLSGCGYPELYERILIHGIGIDCMENGYRVTVRSSVSAEDEGEELFTCEGPTVLEALSSLSLSTGREPFYAHNYLVVFSMDCARKGLDQCLDFFVRYYNTRPSVSLFLAEATAEEVLSAEKDGKLMRMSELESLGSGGKYNGQIADMDILKFVNGVLEEGGAPVLPVLKVTESGVESAATAYFDGYRVKGLLSLEQTRGWLAATGQLKKGELAVSGDEYGTVTLSLRGAKAKLRSVVGIEPEFTVQIDIEADVSAADGNRGQQTGDAFYTALEEAVSQKLKAEVGSAIFQSMQQDGCDIFGFGNLLYRRSPQYWRQNGQAWPEMMTRCAYNLEVDVKVQRLEQEDQEGIG